VNDEQSCAAAGGGVAKAHGVASHGYVGARNGRSGRVKDIAIQYGGTRILTKRRRRAQLRRKTQRP